MIDLLISLCLLCLSFPVFMFALECFLGLKREPVSELPALPSDLTTAILMPAHNEASVIANTLEQLKPHLGENDQLVVIADNCSDNTADIVRNHGFTAIERQHETDRGKGYALDFGLQYLRQQTSPQIVVIVDADCILSNNALHWLKHQVLERKRPAQARYLMLRGDIARITVKVSEFAFKVKNEIRLRGLEQLGLPVPLTGTGMAFPWEAINEATLATGDIVEDMRLGVELTEQGLGATYCDEAYVYSYFPTNEAAEKTQRERWEHGHLNTLKHFVPRLFRNFLSKGNTASLGMMFDLLIPPLSLLVMIVGATAMLVTVLSWIVGSAGQVFYSWSLLVIIALAIGMVWSKHGRNILSAGELAHIPIYIFSKIAIYLGYLIRKQTKWIRTDRD